MKYPLILTLLAGLLLAHLWAGAQNLPLTNQAVEQCQRGDLWGSVSTIQRAIESPSEKGAARTWYVKAYVHKEIFKSTDVPTVAEQHRNLAVEAVEKCMVLDTKGTELEQCLLLLDFISVYIFNDAMLSIAEIQSVEDHKPEMQFNEYLRIRKICDPNGSVAVQTKAFHVAMAEHFYDLYEKNGYARQEYADLSEAHFTSVLALDSLDCDANYNVAVNLYNQGVFKIKQFGITTDIADLIRIQDESIKLFKQALPYLKIAYQNCPNRVNLIRAMYVVNRALDNEEEAELYKTQLEKALKNKP